MMEIDRLNNQIATMKKVSRILLIHQIYFLGYDGKGPQDRTIKGRNDWPKS